MSLLDPKQLEDLLPAETSSFPSPIPTQFVSSDEFTPPPQTEKQKQVEARIKELGTRLAKHQGLSRRAFFQTAAGMAAAFVAMNDVYGPIFGVSPAEAASPDMANERAKALAGQFIMDMHTHFLRDDTRLEGFVRSREAVGKAGWNPGLAGKPQTIDDLKFANYFKEIYFDSDTKVALISGSGSEEPRDWFLTNEMKAEARAKVNQLTGSRRLMSHAIFMPGMPGWMEAVDQAIAQLKPDSFKGYTVGDNTNKQLSKHPWRMDDEKLLYPFYEKMAKAGLVNVCVHKGLYPYSTTKNFPQLVAYADVSDVGKAAKDWPQLNFVIYHSAFRFTGGEGKNGLAQFEQTGRVDWVTDLSEIPGEVRGHQRLRRPRPDLRPEHGGRAEPLRGHDGHARQGPGRRPRGVGHRCHLDGRAAVADRGHAPAGDPRGHAEEVRLPGAGARRRPDQARHLRRELGAALQVRRQAPRRADHRPHRAGAGGLPARRAGRTNLRYGFVPAAGRPEAPKSGLQPAAGGRSRSAPGPPGRVAWGAWGAPGAPHVVTLAAPGPAGRPARPSRPPAPVRRRSGIPPRSRSRGAA